MMPQGLPTGRRRMRTRPLARLLRLVVGSLRRITSTAAKQCLHTTPRSIKTEPCTGGHRPSNLPQVEPLPPPLTGRGPGPSTPCRAEAGGTCT